MVCMMSDNPAGAFLAKTDKLGTIDYSRNNDNQRTGPSNVPEDI